MNKERLQNILIDHVLISEKPLIFQHKEGFYTIGEEGFYIPSGDLKEGIQKAIKRNQSQKAYLKKRALYSLIEDSDRTITVLKEILQQLK